MESKSKMEDLSGEILLKEFLWQKDEAGLKMEDVKWDLESQIYFSICG